MLKIKQEVTTWKTWDYLAKIITNSEEEILEFCKSLEGSGLSDKLDFNKFQMCASAARDFQVCKFYLV